MKLDRLVHDDTVIRRYDDQDGTITDITPAQMLDEILHIVADNPYIINDLDHQLPITVDFRPGDQEPGAKKRMSEFWGKVGEAPPFPPSPARASIVTWAYDGEDPEDYHSVATYSFVVSRPFGRLGPEWEKLVGEE